MKGKRAITNIDNVDDYECFKHAIPYAVYPKKNHSERLTDDIRENAKKFDWIGITFPTPVDQARVFKQHNDYCVNIFLYDDETKCIYPRSISPSYGEIDESKVIDLRLISDRDKNHYCTIVNFSKLLRSSITKHKEARQFCKRCYSHFEKKRELLAHLDYCKNNKDIPILPYVDKDGNPKLIEFKNYKKSKDPEISYFADMECYLNKIKEKAGKNTKRCHKHTSKLRCQSQRSLPHLWTVQRCRTQCV